MALQFETGKYVPVKKVSENAAAFSEIAAAFSKLSMEEFLLVTNEQVSSSTLQASARDFIFPKDGEYLKVSRVTKMEDDQSSKNYGKNKLVAIKLIKTKPPVVKTKSVKPSESQG